MVPAILLLLGFAGELRYSKKLVEKGETTSFKRYPWSKVILYSGAGLVAILASSYYVSYLPLETVNTSPLSIVIPNFDNFLYVTSMAIAEEYFFRGFILDLLLVSTITIPAFGFLKYIAPSLNKALNNNWVKIAFSALIFMFYHYARYGTEPNNLIYVLMGGGALGAINYLTKRLSPSVVAHFANNVLAVMGV